MNENKCLLNEFDVEHDIVKFIQIKTGFVFDVLKDRILIQLMKLHPDETHNKQLI